MTLPKASGRFHATVQAQIAPDEVPPMARFIGSLVKVYFFATSGSISSIRKRA